VTSSVGRAADS